MTTADLFGVQLPLLAAPMASRQAVVAGCGDRGRVRRRPGVPGRGLQESADLAFPHSPRRPGGPAVLAHRAHPRVHRPPGAWPARGLHVACTWPARGLHVACTWPARGLHVACTWPAQRLHRTARGSGPARLSPDSPPDPSAADRGRPDGDPDRLNLWAGTGYRLARTGPPAAVVTELAGSL